MLNIDKQHEFVLTADLVGVSLTFIPECTFQEEVKFRRWILQLLDKPVQDQECHEVRIIVDNRMKKKKKKVDRSEQQLAFAF